MRPFVRLSSIVLSLFACFCCTGSGWAATPASSLGAPRTSTSSGEASPASSPGVSIPGPLRPFLRIAAISQKALPEEVLPLLARNVVVDGYQGRGRGRKPTVYMVLLRRYLEQARELRALAGSDGVIRVSNCSEAQPLLVVLGYRLQEECGPGAAVETADPENAFITIDSGFPLADLEETLRGGKPLAYAFPASRVPVLFKESDWEESVKGKQADIIDSLLHDPDMARLYWALAEMDAHTSTFLRQSPGLKELVPFADVLDFYGSQIRIRSGRVAVPGGPPAESTWKKLVGVGPDSPGEFVTKLAAKDQGWLIAYFDALSRISGAQLSYFTEPRRLQRFYGALRGERTALSPAGSVFRPDPGLLLLVTRLQLDPDGQPHIPGGLETWKEIINDKSDSNGSKIAQGWAKRARAWNNPDQLVEALFAISRDLLEAPLQVYLELSEIDRERRAGEPLSSETVKQLAEDFPRFADQYLVFSEFAGLNNASITRFLNVAEILDRLPDRLARTDAIGLFQANVCLWQILARQGEIPRADWNDSWMRVIGPFSRVNSPAQLFDVARTSLGELLKAAAGKPAVSQEEIITLLAGPQQMSGEARQVQLGLANQMRSIMDAQRLVSLDTLFALRDGLNEVARGDKTAKALMPLAGELQEFQMPKPLFTSSERTEWTAGLYGGPRTPAQRQTDLVKMLKPPLNPKELADAQAQLVPFLRSTLVGLNYAYYAPPGAQMLFNNPLFVRSHDFSGQATRGREQSWQTPSLVGRGWPAGGGAHLTGSLADLPYVLAGVEQNFIVPQNVQSLIWEDLVPCLLTSAVLPRWWRVSRNELRAVTLYQRFGEELLDAAGKNQELRPRVMEILSTRMLPQRFGQLEDSLDSGISENWLRGVTPADTFYLAAEFRRRFPKETNGWGKAGEELQRLAEDYPNEVSVERLSDDFGVPHPALARTYARELLNVRPFPTFLGYSSRLLAESWESNNLYWARLADEAGYQPAALHRLVPELTRRMVEKIFGTHLEDWPALLRALQETGEEFRQREIASSSKTASLQGTKGKL